MTTLATVKSEPESTIAQAISSCADLQRPSPSRNPWFRRRPTPREMTDLKGNDSESRGKTFYDRGERKNLSSLVNISRRIMDSYELQRDEVMKLEERHYKSWLFKILLILPVVGVFYGATKLGAAGYIL